MTGAAAAVAAAPVVPDMSFALSSVYSCWREFDLDGRRTKLDEIGLKVASLQEQSTANRKKLADATREFKRSSSSSSADSEVAKAAHSLLKQYQEEIDTLTRRAKHGESAFLDLYEQLFEAPDPAPALAQALEYEAQLSQLTAQAQKVSSELAEYKAESKAIRNQELTLRKQEDSIRELTAALEAKEQELRDAKQQAAAEADAAVLERMQARESELSDMLASAQSNLEAMQRLYGAAQNQLFELQSTKEEAAAGRQEELELAAAELDAVQGRLMALEAEKIGLQARLETNRQEGATAAGAGSGQGGSSTVEETLRQELNSQRDVSARLRQDLAAARQQVHETEAAWQEKLAALQDQLEEQQSLASKLQLELQLRPTAAHVSELQQQVRALQAVGYGSLEDFAPGSSGTAGAFGDGSSSRGQGGGLQQGSSGGGGVVAGGSGGGGTSGMSLEGMLLAKNRRLEHEVTMARLAVAAASQELESAKDQVSELQEQLQQRSDLITRLEEDLLSVRQAAAVSAAAAPSASAAAAAAAADGGFGGEGGVEGDAGGSDSMLRVLVGQRERLRQRVQELEVALAACKQQVAAAQQELAAARADNVSLIERLRYVGGYRQAAAAARSNAAGGGGSGPGRGDVEAGGGDGDGDVVGKYSQLYDEGINPFKEFQGQQKEQKRKQMSVADKAMYSMGSLVYQSAAARLLTFGYIVILHLLVFASLTHMTHRTSGHLQDHHELLLQAGRHDLTSMLHHDGTMAMAGLPGGGGGAAGAAAAGGGAQALLRGGATSSSNSTLLSGGGG